MSTDPKTIQSYNKYAKKWTQKMRSGNNTAHEYLEKPAMYAKIPDLKGKTVLCIGCGTGEECQYLKSRGTKRIIGIDISEEMVNLAKQSFLIAEFQVMNMEKLQFPKDSFDFVYSSLTFSYVKKWTKTLKNIFDVLKPNGTLLFSANHPLKWGAELKREKDKNTFVLGYIKYKNKDECEIFGDYLNERKINDIWFEEFPVSYYHKPLSSSMREILDAGFEIVDFIEPKAIIKARKAKMNFWKIHQKIPLFMIFELRKKNN